MEIIMKAQMNHDDMITRSAVFMSACRDSGHCKYCIRGRDYCN